MGGEQEGSTVPPAARAFLERHRPAQDNLGSARRDADHESRDNDDGEDDDEARDQRGDDGELEVDGHRVDGGHDVAEIAELGVPAPPIPMKNLFLALRPRAKGVNHPSVPTRAAIERHALEQHVNYAPWCPRCVQASAVMRKHPIVAGVDSLNGSYSASKTGVVKGAGEITDFDRTGNTYGMEACVSVGAVNEASQPFARPVAVP